MKTWKEPSLQDITDYTMCFACGRENPIGLRLTLRHEGETVKTEFTPGECHQGWPGIVHGGIINTLLDEAMAYVPIFQGLYCVTAKMEVRIRNTPSIGQPLFVSSWMTRRTRRLIDAEAEITLEDGTTVAEGKATMYIVKEVQKRLG